jgi:hypothetical protein
VRLRNGIDHGIVRIFRSVNPGDALGGGHKAAEHLFHGIGYLAHGGPGTDGLDAGCQQVAAFFGGLGDAVQGAARGRIVASALSRSIIADLVVAHLVRDFQHVHLGIFVELVFVDADDDIQPLVDAGLFAGRRLFDAHLGHAGFDGLGHAAQFLHLVDDLAGFT